MSWGVRRIEDESTDPMYGGGRRSAMSVGEWLDSVSSGPRGRAQPAAPVAKPEPTPPAALETLDRKLEELNRRLKRLSDAPKTQGRDRRPDRDNRQTSARHIRDRDEPSVRREPEPDPVATRLDQIDKRLAELARLPAESRPFREPEPDTASRAVPARHERGAHSDADRMRQGLREIERLQAMLLEGLNERNSKAGHAIERHLQEERERTHRYMSPVAETIARLEAEVRGLRQSVESRPEPAQSAFDDSDLVEMRRMLARIAEVSTGRQESAQIERLFDEMNRIRDLVVETGTKALSTTAAKTAQEMRLADMVERLASVATTAQEKTSEDMRSLDRRLADVAERMGEIEARGGNTKDLADLQRAINGIAARLDRPQPVAKPVIPAGLIDLDIRIEKLSEKLDRIEPSPVTPRQMASLETEIGALRLDLAQTAGTRGTGRLEEQIIALSERIDRLATTAFASTARAPNLDTFEARIGDLVDVIDRMVGSESRLDTHVDALSGEVGALRRDLAEFAAPLPHPGIEEQMRLITERLDVAARQSVDPRVLARIDEKIGRLTDLIHADRHAPAGTMAIEEKLGKLEALLLDQREDAIEAASVAAREAVREFASFAKDARRTEAEVLALEEDLRRVQDATRSTETRTSDALQSVQEALTTIISRLGAIERSASERALERIAEQRMEPRVPERETAPTRPVEPLMPNRQAAPQVSGEAVVPQPRAVAPPEARAAAPPMRSPDAPALSPEDHRPLEPGSGKPRVPPTQAPVMPGAPIAGGAAPGRAPQPAAPQMPRPPQATAGVEDDAPVPKRNEFIAAARRAALAASQAGPAAPPIPGDKIRPEAYSDNADDAAKGKTSLLGSLFKGKQKAMIVAGVSIAAAATGLSFVASSVTRMASVDTLSTASIAPAMQTAPRPASPPPASNPQSTASIALAPPSTVTSTFAPLAPTSEADRQAALANAMKQAAMAQGYQAIPQTGPSLTPNPAASAQPAPVLQSPAPGDVSVSDTPTQSISTAPVAAGPITPPAEKIGSRALRMAAVNGDPKAQFEVGMRFLEGRGVAPDPHEANIWFERAASKHLALAAYQLAKGYDKGIGLDRNPSEAKRWYRVAAEGGNIAAMHNLGVLYAGERDLPSALPWFQKAADTGLKDSQFNLGVIYATGTGVRPDFAVAYKWFALCALFGDQEAGRKRDDVATRLDHTQLAAAKLAVSTWRATPVSPEANEANRIWSEPAGATASVAPAQVTPPAAAPSPPSGWTRLMQAQAALQGRGLYTGKIDGEMTPETKAAIKAFQKKAGLRQTGEIDNAFMSALMAKQI